MSLLDRLKKPTPVHQVTVTHAAPVTNGTNGHAQAERLAQIEAEKRRLMEEDAQPAKPVSAAVINPPDAPKPSLVEAADPIPAEVALGIADKALREKVETHAKAHVEVEAAKTETTVTAKKSEGGGRCPEGGKRIVLSPDQLVGREVRCGCGKSIKVKPDKDADGRWGVSLPGHNMPKVEQAEVASVPKPAAAPAATVDVFEQVSATDDEPVRPIEQGAAPAGITIFVNVVVEGAMGGCSLESYYAPLVKEIEQKYGAAELRVGPKDSPLAFGGWKGVLAAVVRENQPAPGAYTIFAPGEVAEVVIDALRSTATIYRGVR